ncbi:MAG: HAD family hydrolase [Acidobacteria bacterium]|nr:HAD family hydrolase [Acidobacteriota bacterium]
MTRLPVKAVFFDVDFTLIYPGPMFQGVGYHQFCTRYGIGVEIDRFADAVRAAASILNDEHDQVYDPALFVRYTRRIIEGMGGEGHMLDACAEEIYAEWAACHHFVLYDDVSAVLKELASRGIRVGLISNSHRSLDSFQAHFELDGLIAGALSSSDHGFLKPHPSIFESALELLGVSAAESVMVGDSLLHDIEGARRVGMRGVLIQRSPQTLSGDLAGGVPVIRELSELPPLLV